MTILLYSGTPGSGKSLHATRDIRDALKFKKKAVICNYEVVIDERWKGSFNYVPNLALNPGMLVSFAVDWWDTHKFQEDGIVVVIDECQLLFNSRNWMDADRMEWLEFFSQHRKYGYKVIFIAQSDIMIDKQFRTLIEYEVNHRKVGNYGMFGTIVKLICLGEMFYACRYYYKQSQKLDGEFFRYTKKISRMYNSYDSFKGGSSLGVRSAPRLQNVL